MNVCFLIFIIQNLSNFITEADNLKKKKIKFHDQKALEEAYHAQ